MQRLSLKLQMRSTLCAMAAALSLLTSAAPSFAQNADGIEVLDAGAVEAPLSESAREMARQIVPFPLLVASQNTTNARVFEIGHKRDPEAFAILQREPGLLPAIRKANDSAVMALIRSDYPTLIENLAIHYDRAFTEEQRLELIRFFATSAGNRYIRVNMAPADRQVIERLMADADGYLEKDEFDAILGDFRERAIKQLSADDQAFVKEFLSTNLGLAYQKGFDEEDRITLNWVNEGNAKLPPMVTDAVTAAVERYINKGSQ
jgi:hypothetical protein